MKISVGIILLLLLHLGSFAQDQEELNKPLKEHKKPQKERMVFEAFGSTIPLADLFVTPTENFNVPLLHTTFNGVTFTNTIVNNNLAPVKLNGLSLFTFSYLLRLNLNEISADNSVSVMFAPSLGITLNEYQSDPYTLANDNYPIGKLNVPLQLEINWGAGATYKSAKNYGFVVRMGINYSLTPILYPSSIATSIDNYGNTLTQTPVRFSYLQFTAGFGFRNWTTNGKLREIGLQIFAFNGYGAQITRYWYIHY